MILPHLVRISNVTTRKTDLFSSVEQCMRTKKDSLIICCSVYFQKVLVSKDPIMLVAPFMVTARLMLKDIYKGWVVKTGMRYNLLTLFRGSIDGSDLPILKKLTVDRKFFPGQFDSTQFNVFWWQFPRSLQLCCLPESQTKIRVYWAHWIYFYFRMSKVCSHEVYGRTKTRSRIINPERNHPLIFGNTTR